MQAIMEALFDAAYLITVIGLGILLISGAKGRKQYRLYGWMALVLGFGDAFHLVPRVYALFTDGLSAHAASLGVGKLITSITMTFFYVMLYKVYRLRYKVKRQEEIAWSIYGLAAIRIILCLYPQNDWLNGSGPLSWGIYRNIPFAATGVIMILLFYKTAKEKDDTAFRRMWLAIALSFAFYIPVVLFADAVPLAGVLMIPKTCAYVWIVWMGFSDMRKKKGETAE